MDIPFWKTGVTMAESRIWFFSFCGYLSYEAAIFCKVKIKGQFLENGKNVVCTSQGSPDSAAAPHDLSFTLWSLTEVTRG